MKRKVTKEQVKELIDLYLQGEWLMDLARKYKLDHTTVLYHIKKHGVHNARVPRKNTSRTYYVKSRKFPQPKSYKDYLKEAKEREQKEWKT